MKRRGFLATLAAAVGLPALARMLPAKPVAELGGYRPGPEWEVVADPRCPPGYVFGFQKSDLERFKIYGNIPPAERTFVIRDLGNG